MRHYVNPILTHINGQQRIAGFYHNGKKYIINEILKTTTEYWLLVLQVRIGHQTTALYWEVSSQRWFVYDKVAQSKAA